MPPVAAGSQLNAIEADVGSYGRSEKKGGGEKSMPKSARPESRVTTIYAPPAVFVCLSTYVVYLPRYLDEEIPRYADTYLGI